MKNFSIFFVLGLFSLGFIACETKKVIEPVQTTPVVVTPVDTTSVVNPEPEPEPTNNIKTEVFFDSTSQQKIKITYIQNPEVIKPNGVHNVGKLVIENLPEGYMLEALSLRVNIQMLGEKVDKYIEGEAIEFPYLDLFEVTTMPDYFKYSYRGIFAENNEYFLNIKTKNYSKRVDGVIFLSTIFILRDESGAKVSEIYLDFITTEEIEIPVKKFEV